MKTKLHLLNGLRSPMILTLLLACIGLSNAQTPVERLVQQSGEATLNLSIENQRIVSDEFNSFIDDYVLFSYDESASRTIKDEKPENLTLTVPTPNGSFEMKLVATTITSPDFRIESSSGNVLIDGPIGQHYRGIIEGEEGSVAAVSFFENSISVLGSTKSLGNFTINKLDADARHIAYFDNDFVTEFGYECHTEEPEELPEFLQNARMQQEILERQGGNCVRVHLEAAFELYNNRGTVAATASFIEGAFNQLAVLYANESINTVISYIHVWDTPDPFRGTSSSDAIDDFQAYILQGAVLNGDLGHLLALDAGGNGGIARGIGVLCLNDDGRLAYSDIDPSFGNVPTYSWTVMVMTHEMGHNLGSPHTHGCYWNGNGTQIDDCGNAAGQTEGAACYNTSAPIIPAFGTGGTIMSYCHLNATGINFTNGFGQQPGDLIRTFYNGAPCLASCPVSPCVEPYQLLITSVSETTADVTWYHATEVNFNVTYGYPGNMTTIPVNGTSTQLTGLDAGKKYTVTVSTDCGGTTSEAVSNVFSTICDQVFGLPYVELFEDDVWVDGSYRLDPCWTTELSGNGYGWTVTKFNTSSANTGPDGDHTTGVGKYVYAEASFGAANDDAVIISPRIDLGASADPFVTFWYHMFGATVNRLRVDVSTDNGASWTLLQTLNGAQQIAEDDKWEQSQLSLAAYAGEEIKFRFTARRGADFQGDIAIDDLIVTDSTLVDVAVAAINSPENGCGIGAAETVSITIQNSGYQTITAGTDIDLVLTLNGANPINETLTLTTNVLPDGIQEYTFNAALDLSFPGTYEVGVAASMAGDGIAGNNVRGKQVINKSVVSTFPYEQSFEFGSDWTAGGIESSWALGTPNKSIIIGSSDGANSWVTGGLGLGTYNADEESYIEGPCFDFSNLDNPKVELDVWWEIETIWEGATFQYSTDAGETWQTLGSSNDPNWFNADTITTLPGIDGWTGTADSDPSFVGSGGWKTMSHDLTGLGMNPNVFLRVFFKTDGFVAFDGIAIDNIKITGDVITPACYTDTTFGTTCDPLLAGTITDVFQDVNGCDSIEITITQLLASYDEVIEIFTCDAAQVGSSVQSLTTFQGCDSIITTNTILAPLYNITQNETTCDPTAVGTVSTTYTSTVYGCDSTVNVVTALQEAYMTNIMQTSCNPADSGVTVVTLTAADGCDSMVTTTTTYTAITAAFVANPNGATVSFINQSLNADSYVWDFGDGGSNTDINTLHTYATGGVYTVTLTASSPGCPDEVFTQTITIDITAIESITFIEEINVYPNPSNGNFAIELKGQNVYEDLSLNLIDVRGKVIDSRSLVFNSYLKEVYGLSNLSNGVYFLRIKSNDEITTLKINILK